MSLLTCRDLTVGYGHALALHGISFEVGEGEVVSMIGANGAGKSTCLRTLSGLLRPRAGRIELDGHRIDRERPEAIVARGIAHVPEGRRIFPGLTVRENLELASVSWRRGRSNEVAGELQRIFELFPRLAERRSQRGWSLSGGEQQMVAIGRALMARPRIILLDEPSLGLAPQIVASVFATLREVNATGTAILLVEQSANLALEVSTRAYVIENGRITIAGASRDLAADPRIRAAYLGEHAAHEDARA
jgi:branched-chain amino acid transport system ATP-binding protein